MDTIRTFEEAFSPQHTGHVYRLIIEHTERQIIEKALERAYGNQVLAARILGLNRNTMRSKVRKYHIEVTQYKL